MQKRKNYALSEVSNSSNKAWTIDRFFSNMQQKNLELIYLRKSKDLWTNLSKTHFILFSILKGGISVAIVYFDLPVAKFSWHSGKKQTSLIQCNVLSLQEGSGRKETNKTRIENLAQYIDICIPSISINGKKGGGGDPAKVRAKSMKSEDLYVVI